MKKTELSEVKKAEIDTILGKATALRKEITGLILDKNVSKLSDLREVKKKRRDLAQVLTVLRQKQLLKDLEEKREK